jgi:lipoprotein-anchoring transpeptidase ErfK/SrfK
MRHGLRVALAMVALTTALPAGAAAAAAKPAAVPGPTVRDPVAALLAPGDARRLSNETTITRWAHANDAYPIRTAARTDAKTITRLRYLTEDKLPEVYLVLDAKLDADGTPWLHIRIPMRPNGRTGWVPADRLSQLYVVRTQLVIDRGARRARLYKAGQQIWESRIGVGKAGTPTPRGRFYVRELLRGDGATYGPWAFGTSDYSALSDWPGGGVIGIHGTDQPQLIPGAPSHGCVRVPNDKILRLKALMPIGTPVRVIN